MIGGDAMNVSGGYTKASSAAASANSSDNTVTLGGGVAVSANVNGGYADISSATGASTAYARRNAVTIGDGTYADNIYGGLVDTGSNTSAIVEVTNNTVTLTGAPSFAGSTELWGGFNLATATPAFSNLFRNNRLIIENPISSPVATIGNFQNMELMITANSPAIQTTALTLGGNSNTTTIDRIDVTSGSAPLTAGQTVTVIGASGTVTNPTLIDPTSIGQQGAATNYTYDDIKYDSAAPTGAGVTARVATATLNPTTAALGTSNLSQLSLYGQASNLMIQQLLPFVSDIMPDSGAQAFFVTDWGKSRYDTGSHSDVEGYTMMAGAAMNQKTAFGSLALSAFVEYGSGDYNSSGTYSGVHAKSGGDSSFTGVGVLGRFAWSNNFYTDASIHTGKSKSDFSSNDLAFGQRASYDIKGNYVGAHVGVGYIMPINPQMKLDMSARYLWNRIDGDSATILGDRFRFDDITSERLRVGGRLSYAVDNRFTPYVGLYYDHEFDGRATGDVYGFKLKGVKVTGGTTNAEVGFTYKPQFKNDALMINLGLLGYTGKREGYSGVLKASWAF